MQVDKKKQIIEMIAKIDNEKYIEYLYTLIKEFLNEKSDKK